MKKPRGDLAPASADVRVLPYAPPPAPTTEDGRNIDGALGVLEGEAATIVSRHPDEAASLGEETLAKIATPLGASTTYYEQPILKAPVWKAYVPTYFFVGGVAGGCLAFGAAAQGVGGGLRSIVGPARWIGAAGIASSAALLVADLGRPSRFINMLRVFRPTSPMNVGTWLLTATGAAAGAAAVLPLVGARRLADAAGLVAGVLGLAVSTYTGVLVSATAVPAWQYGGRTLPPVFAASAAASAAAALDLVPGAKRASRALEAFGLVGKVAELATGLAYERSLAKKGDVVVRHLRSGRAGALFRASQALTLASIGASLAKLRRVSGLLGLGGALALRFAIMNAGRSSTRDPRATFEPQRA